MTPSVLFADPLGSYEGHDVWGIDRDARTYPGPNPVVAHPPCNLWVNLAAVNWKLYRRQLPAWYPGGTDHECFAAALHFVRSWGGVLEHPAFSHAWKHHGLTPPPQPADKKSPVGPGWLETTPHEYVCEVWQAAYGHRARKRTWLLYAGPPPPELRWDRPAGTHQVGWFDRIKPTVGKREASATPPAFRDELLRLATYAANGEQSEHQRNIGPIVDDPALLLGQPHRHPNLVANHQVHIAPIRQHSRQ